jgi:hypothetical protein
MSSLCMMYKIFFTENHPLSYLIHQLLFLLEILVWLIDRSHQHAFAISRCHTEQFRHCFLNFILLLHGINFLPQLLSVSCSTLKGLLMHLFPLSDFCFPIFYSMFFLIMFRAIFSLPLFSPSDAKVIFVAWL